MIECYHDRKPPWTCIPLLLTIKVSMSCIFLFTRSLVIAPHLRSTYILFSSDLLHIHPKVGRDSMQFVLTVYESYNKPYILYYEENCIFFCVQNKYFLKKIKYFRMLNKDVLKEFQLVEFRLLNKVQSKIFFDFRPTAFLFDCKLDTFS